jgi:hypothetical protein
LVLKTVEMLTLKGAVFSQAGSLHEPVIDVVQYGSELDMIDVTGPERVGIQLWEALSMLLLSVVAALGFVFISQSMTTIFSVRASRSNFYSCNRSICRSF